MVLSAFAFRLNARRMLQYQRPGLVQFYGLPKIADGIVHGELLHGAVEFV